MDLASIERLLTLWFAVMAFMAASGGGMADNAATTAIGVVAVVLFWAVPVAIVAELTSGIYRQ